MLFFVSVESLLGFVCKFFLGQKTLPPNIDSRAGRNVRDARSITVTTITLAEPTSLKSGIPDSERARQDIITVRALVKTASPAHLEETLAASNLSDFNSCLNLFIRSTT